MKDIIEYGTNVDNDKGCLSHKKITVLGKKDLIGRTKRGTS